MGTLQSCVMGRKISPNKRMQMDASRLVDHLGNEASLLDSPVRLGEVVQRV